MAKVRSWAGLDVHYVAAGPLHTASCDPGRLSLRRSAHGEA
jgi:hypothetical protein